MYRITRNFPLTKVAGSYTPIGKLLQGEVTSAISLKVYGKSEIIGVNWGHEYPGNPRTS